jgi:hypothetical protein
MFVFMSELVPVWFPHVLTVCDIYIYEVITSSFTVLEYSVLFFRW